MSELRTWWRADCGKLDLRQQSRYPQDGIMHRMWLPLLLSCALLPSAQAQPAPGPGGTARTCVAHPDYLSIDILDPALPLPRRQLQAGRLREMASNPACGADYDYLLAHLYLHGEDLPGNPVPRDLQHARRLLERAGAMDSQMAYAELAELSLAQGEAREAMQWTQVYLSLQQIGKGEHRSFDRRGYNVDLLLRAQTAWNKAKIPGDRKARTALLNQYLQRRRVLAAELQAISSARQAAEQAAGDESPAGEDRDPQVKEGTRNPEVYGRIIPGYAMYLLEIQPDGRVSRIALEAFGPLREHGDKLRTHVDGWVFHPIGGNKPMVVRVPVVTGYASGGPRLR